MLVYCLPQCKPHLKASYDIYISFLFTTEDATTSDNSQARVVFHILLYQVSHFQQHSCGFSWLSLPW